MFIRGRSGQFSGARISFFFGGDSQTQYLMVDNTCSIFSHAPNPCANFA